MTQSYRHATEQNSFFLSIHLDSERHDHRDGSGRGGSERNGLGMFFVHIYNINITSSSRSTLR